MRGEGLYDPLEKGVDGERNCRRRDVTKLRMRLEGFDLEGRRER